MEPVRLLLVDDHPVVRSGYKRYLEGARDIEVVAEAESGAEAYRAFVAHRPDVVVLDIGLPDVSGLEVLRRLRRRSPEAKVLIFTIHENALLVEKALGAGARGYLTKRCGPKTVLAAVREVGRGGMFVEPLHASLPDFSCALLGKLTAREFEVFRLLAEGRSVAEIAQLLYLSPKTVGVHQTRILKKLGLPNTVRLALLAVRCGVIPV